jgi:tetratricopeptide (TPR) repeat protein
MPFVTDSAPATTRCQNCGTEIPPAAGRCPSCGRSLNARSAKVVLAITLFGIILGFALTQYFVNVHRATESSLAVRWFTRGNQAMQARLPAAAAEDYRTALSYDPENGEDRLRLAQALLADNRLNEAQSHLFSLWEDEPADGEVNLTLARLHAKKGDYTKAVRYYGDAINGVWDEEPRRRRIATRFELVHYLMQQSKLAQAQAELAALQADAPTDPADQLLLASLLLQVNEAQRSLDAYDAVLAHDPKNAQAWLGKGEAAMALGDYIEAERSLANAVDGDHNLSGAHEQLELARQILRFNPSLRGLSLAERSARVAEAFHVALERLNGCAKQQGYSLAAPTSQASANAATASPPSPSPSPAPIPAPSLADDQLQRLYTAGAQQQSTTTERALRSDPDALEPTMQYVFGVERATAAICPQMDVADRALLTLAQHQGETLK